MDVDDRANRPKQATSEDIPRAVEFLILFVIRWMSCAASGIFGLVSIAGWFSHWPRWVVIPSSILAARDPTFSGRRFDPAVVFDLIGLARA